GIVGPGDLALPIPKHHPLRIGIDESTEAALGSLALGDVDHGAMKIQSGARRVALDPTFCLQPAELPVFLPDPILDIVVATGLDGAAESVRDTRLVLLHYGPE